MSAPIDSRAIHRYDFGVTFRVTRCFECNTLVWNRGCGECSTNFCKSCFASHDCAQVEPRKEGTPEELNIPENVSTQAKTNAEEPKTVETEAGPKGNVTTTGEVKANETRTPEEQQISETVSTEAAMSAGELKADERKTDETGNVITTEEVKTNESKAPEEQQVPETVATETTTIVEDLITEEKEEEVKTNESQALEEQKVPEKESTEATMSVEDLKTEEKEVDHKTTVITDAVQMKAEEVKAESVDNAENKGSLQAVDEERCSPEASPDETEPKGGDSKTKKRNQRRKKR